MKICWKCREKIKLFGEESNYFIERSSKRKVLLHNSCYLELTKYERKQLLYDVKMGPPKGLRKNLKLVGFALGLAGGFGYSSGAFSGKMAGTRHALKKKGMTMEELDDMCIDGYGYHYAVLPSEIQNEVLNKIR